MNRTGLAIALIIGAVVGIVFGVYPQLDIAIAAWFYDPVTHTFAGKMEWIDHVRDAATALIALLVAPAIFAILGKLVMPKRRMLIPGRAVSEPLAGARAGLSRQRRAQGPLGADAADRCRSIRRRRKVHRLVGSAR